MASILQAPGRSTSDEPHKDAQRMAELLAKTTQASIEMSRAIDFGANPEQGDSLRVALAALAGELIGAYYKNVGKAPTENDLKKMTAALQTVLTYSDNFMPGSDAVMRLDNLSAYGQNIDAPQTALQYIHAFIPVVNAVTAFPFGQPEQKLIMDLSSRLIQRAMEIRESVFENLAAGDEKRIELSIVAMLTKIYAACHSAETARLMSLTEQQQATAGIGLESVWKMFELRIGIIEALARTLIPAGGTASGGSAKAPSPIAAAPVSPPPNVPPAPPLQTPPADALGSSPMSMFVKKPEGETPPQAPPAAGSGQGSGPMSFFKGPPKKDDGQ